MVLMNILTMKTMNKIYVVKYCGGSYDDYYNVIIFATAKKSIATKYVTKFNRILKNWKEYYKQFEEDSELGFGWIKKEYVESHFNRWYNLQNITKCYYEEIQVR